MSLNYNAIASDLNALCRGDDFCTAFSSIGDVRSLVPDNVHIVALTATVTVESFSTIAERLSLKSPALIGIKPNQPNIKYFVEPLPSLENSV